MTSFDVCVPLLMGDDGKSPADGTQGLDALDLLVDCRDRQALLLGLWQQVRIDWSFAAKGLADALRGLRGLRVTERRVIGDTLFGMIRQARRIDDALHASGIARTRIDDRLRLLAYLVLDGGLSPQRAAAQASAVQWTDLRDYDARIDREHRGAARLARRYSFPDWMARMVAQDLGDDAEGFLRSLNQRAPTTLRANRLRVDRDTLAQTLREQSYKSTPCERALDGISVEGYANLRSLAAFRDGLFEAQDEGSQLIAALVRPTATAPTLDFCAGAGGKSLALSALLDGRGRIVASDVDRRKLNELRKRAKRGGHSNIQVVELVGGRLPQKRADALRGGCARVLVDAPCSGIGALRRNPEARWQLSEDIVGQEAARQRTILDYAADFVAPGGELVYATCTVAKRENHKVVEGFIRRHSGFERLDAIKLLAESSAASPNDLVGPFLELLPHKHGTDGFFAAVLRRRDGHG